MVSPPLRRGGDSAHRLLHISDFLKWAQDIFTSPYSINNYPMKKKLLLFSIPFILLAVFSSHGFLPFLLLPIIILVVNYLVDRKENNPVLQEMKGTI